MAVKPRSCRRSVFLSEDLDVLRLPALRSLGYIELNGLTFLQRTESVALNCGEVDKNVLAICSAQKPEAFGVVKPFHCSLFHFIFPFLIESIAELKVGLFAGQAIHRTGKNTKSDSTII
jgi:hypothetical protein